MTSVWTRFAEWDDRRAWRRAKATYQAAASATRNAPGTMVKVAVSGEIAAPAAQVWALRTDPMASANLGEFPVERAFVIPGTPRGQVGEQYCLVRRSSDRSTHVTIHEVIELEEGHRRCTRNLSSPRRSLTTVQVEPLSAGSCTLRVFFVSDHPGEEPESYAASMEMLLNRELWRLRHHVGDPSVLGAEPPPLPPDFDQKEAALLRARAAADRRSREPLNVRVSADFDAPVGVVWDLVARSDSPVAWGVSCGCGDGRGFTVPGTPVHAVGEVRAMLSHHAGEPLDITFTEVVELVPGKALATVTPGAPYPSTRTFRFREIDGRCRVELEHAGDAFSSTLSQERGGRRSIAEQYLAMVRRQVATEAVR